MQTHHSLHLNDTSHELAGLKEGPPSLDALFFTVEALIDIGFCLQDP
jgi:hypothetical protein